MADRNLHVTFFPGPTGTLIIRHTHPFPAVVDSPAELAERVEEVLAAGGDVAVVNEPLGDPDDVYPDRFHLCWFLHAEIRLHQPIPFVPKTPTRIPITPV